MFKLNKKGLGFPQAFFIFLTSSIAHAETSLSLAPLYWQTTSDALDTCIKNGNLETVSLPYDPGFKFAIDQTIPNDYTLSLTFTHYHSHANSTSNGASFPTWMDSETNGTVQSSAARWRLHLGLLDLHLSTPIACSPSFTLIPFVGTEYAVVREKFFLTYTGPTLLPSSEDTVHMKNKFWGIGPSGGLQTEWRFAGGWHLYGNFQLALPYGQLYVHQSEDATLSPEERLQLHATAWQPQFSTDLATGFGWRSRHCLLRLGFEQLLFLHHIQLKRFVNSLQSAKFIEQNGSLSTSGPIASFTWTF
jgi:hypothetical protein